MEAAHIRRVTKRYRLRPSNRDAQPRLDRIFALVLEDRLELALELAGVSPHEEICIREVSSRFRPRLSHTDESLATEWSLELADTIREAAGGSSSSDVVRYASRVHAFADLAAGVAREDYRRAWAWRRMGLWSGPERVSGREAAALAIRALVAEPPYIVPVLAALARRGRIAGLAARLEAKDWFELAAAASRVAGATITSLPSAQLFTTAPSPPEDDTEASPADTPFSLEARRIVERSALAAVASIAPVEALTALATLALIEVEPSAARRDPAVLALLLRQIGAGLAQRRAAAPESTPHDSQAPKTEAARKGAEPTPGPRPEDDETTEEDSPPALRVAAETAFGGLFFLLGVMEDLGLPFRLAETLAPHPLAWALHQLAMTFTEAAPGDPAALAFAGLPPDSEPPSLSEDPPSDEELRRIHLAATEVVAELLRRLDRLEMGASQLLSFVCVRSARILADPGWFEVRFPLREVSTDLRRAGLDLDPGYLPWLGVVVKFVYE